MSFKPMSKRWWQRGNATLPPFTASPWREVESFRCLLSPFFLIGARAKMPYAILLATLFFFLHVCLLGADNDRQEATCTRPIFYPLFLFLLVMTATDDLPNEILFYVASLMDMRCLWTMGAVCRRFRLVTRDQRLWRHLFMRDLARKYDRGLTRRPPPTMCHDVPNWPPEARLIYERSHAASTMPAPCGLVANLPAPFAHAFAVGKDWLWLCLAYTRKMHGRSSGPGFVRHGDTFVIGDWTDGMRSGYGVSIRLSRNGSVAAWTESFDDSIAPWRIHHSAFSTGCRTSEFIFGDRYYDNRRHWETHDQRAIDSNSEWTGATNVRVEAYTDDMYTVTAFRNRSRHGVGRTVFANGDVQMLRYANDRPTGEGAYMCSLQCPDAQFAGRTFTCRWRAPYDWRHARYDIAIPEDAISDGARLFWQYVERGLLGWNRDDLDQRLQEQGNL